VGRCYVDSKLAIRHSPPQVSHLDTGMLPPKKFNIFTENVHEFRHSSKARHTPFRTSRPNISSPDPARVLNDTVQPLANRILTLNDFASIHRPVCRGLWRNLESTNAELTEQNDVASICHANHSCGVNYVCRPLFGAYINSANHCNCLFFNGTIRQNCKPVFSAYFCARPAQPI
jgi:hypothetical protein